MNAGTVYVDVRADYAAFEQGIARVETVSAQGGEKSAKGFSEKFSAYIERSKGQISRKLEGFINPIQIVNALGDGLKTFNETGDVTAALEGTIKSIPLVGAAYELGTQIGTALGNAFSDADEMEESLKARGEQMDAMAKRAAEINKMRDEERSAIFGQKQESGDLERKLAIETARIAGDERRAADIEAIQAITDIEKNLASELAASMSEEETALIKDNHRLRLDLIEQELAQKYKKIEGEEAKIAESALKADQDRIQDAAREAADVARKAANEAEKEAKRAADQEERNRSAIAKIESDRISSQTAGITSGATAIGSFRFDAYPDSDKRRNDERMVKGIEAIATGQLSMAGGFV